MKLTFALVLIAGLVGLGIANAGEKAGNGGDFVVCGDRTYSLDYVVANALGFADRLVKPRTLEESLDRIQDRLNATIPELAKEFAAYRALLGNHDDWLKERIWVASSFELKRIHDEDLEVELPKTCGSPIQAVRRSGSGPIQYLYNKAAVDRIESQPLQASFLFVHEWLWDYAPDAPSLRKMNAYLHSSFFTSDGDDRIYATLVRFGLEDRFEIESVIERKRAEVERHNAELAKLAQDPACRPYFDALPHVAEWIGQCDAIATAAENKGLAANEEEYADGLKRILALEEKIDEAVTSLYAVLEKLDWDGTPQLNGKADWLKSLSDKCQDASVRLIMAERR